MGRGAIHICIMGEIYSSLPSLYNQDDDLLVDTLLEEDKSRTNNCALFFVKRGFPFISILDGGFFFQHILGYVEMGRPLVFLPILYLMNISQKVRHLPGLRLPIWNTWIDHQRLVLEFYRD